MAAPIMNPPTPFTTIIPGGFFPGKMVRIRGFVPMHAQRFDINLQTGQGGEIAGEDVALHASVRLTEGYIARNTFQGGCWQEELGDGGFPIQMGQRFEFLILCEAFDYKIAINGQHFCSFPPRVPYSRITHLLIEGDVQLEMISWEGSGATAPPMNEPPKYGEAVAPPQYAPQQTYVQQSAPMPPPGAVAIRFSPEWESERRKKALKIIGVTCLVTLLCFILLFFIIAWLVEGTSKKRCQQVYSATLYFGTVLIKKGTTVIHSYPRRFYGRYRKQNPVIGFIIILIFFGIFATIVYFGVKSHNEFKEESDRHMREFREKHGFK